MFEILKKFEKLVNPILTVIAVTSMLFTVDAYYAKASAVEKLEMRLEQKILQDRQDKVQERMWTLEDRFIKKERVPREVTDQIRRLQIEKDEIKRKLDVIEQKVNKK